MPDGPTVTLMQKLARKHRMVIVVPIYEEEQPGIYYNTAAVIDADGRYLGKYRKTHIPHCKPGFWEKFYFRPGNLGYPVFETAYAKVGVYICYDRHFPEGARALGLNGAEIVFNPSATVAGLSEYLWELEQPAHAVANGYFVGAINRVGNEAPWNIGEFYGKSYFCDPRGKILAQGPRDADAVITADLNLDMIDEVRVGLAVLPRPPARRLRPSGSAVSARPVASAQPKTYRNFIGGEWVASEADAHASPNLNPADTRDVLGPGAALEREEAKVARSRRRSAAFPGLARHAGARARPHPLQGAGR